LKVSASGSSVSHVTIAETRQSTQLLTNILVKIEIVRLLHIPSLGGYVHLASLLTHNPQARGNIPFPAAHYEHIFRNNPSQLNSYTSLAK